MSNKGIATGLALVLTCTLLISLSNAGFEVLGFADAAEFALISKIAGVAHAPGFPAYVMIAHLATAVLGLSGLSHTASLILLSAVCMALASCFLYLSSIIILRHTFKDSGALHTQMISICTAIAPVTGTTLWHWSHSVEVYSMQVLFLAIAFYGLCLREDGNTKPGSIVAALGVGGGLANHHLSMILFLPFLLLLWNPGWLNKENLKARKGRGNKLNELLTNQDTLRFAGLTLLVVLICYGWMFIRASAPLPFAFGQPNNLSRLFYHLTGGAWINNTTTVVKGIMSMRLPYFLRITFEQLFLFIPFLLLGIFYLITSGRKRLWVSVTSYFLLLFLYQLRIDQTADTDAYLCMPYFLLFTLMPIGMARVSGWYARAFYILPAFVLIQAMLHYSKTDLRRFDLSQAMMRDLDRSAPPNSVILIADWTNVINYHYARIVYGFRPDLVVLNYDIKFTHYELLKRNYPSFYKEIAPAYDRFIQLLEAAHPQEVYNTGCNLDQPDLSDSYRKLILAIREYCEKKRVPLMTDPKAYVFLSQMGLFPDAEVSGSYLSNMQGIGNDEFLQLQHNWLDLPRTGMDPSASDKLVDLEAALDLQQRYWTLKGDTGRQAKALEGYNRIKKIQRRMKKKMAFLFRRS